MNDDDERRVRALTCWRDAGALAIAPLAGGMTNANYLVHDGDARLVVRLGEDIPEHHVSRAAELAASRAAQAAGVAPAVRHAAPGALVLEHVAGRTLAPEDIAGNETLLERVVALVARAHGEIPRHLRGPAPAFWVFHIVRDYAATLAESRSPHAGELDALLEVATSLERAAAPFDIVFGHNDLLAANLIDDGERLWLVDWEYAGFNTPLFDLGGLATNNALDETAERRMLERYFERAVDDALWRRYLAMSCASLLRETLWSMVSELRSSLDVDYAAYTAENRERFERARARFAAL